MNRKKASLPAPKLYRSIREVSSELDVKPHVLRYWETQFPSLRPKKNRAGNRIYRPEEVTLLARIKELLYEKRFTIEGARRLLNDERKPRTSSRAASAPAEPPAASVASPTPILRTSEAEVARLAQAARAASESARQAEVERERIAAALSAAEAGLTAAAEREKARAAALTALRLDLAALARELRAGEGGPETPAEEERVRVRAAAPAPSPEEERILADDVDERPEFPVSAVPLTVGA